MKTGAPPSAVPESDPSGDSGVDITLLIANLRLTPTERVRRAQRMLDSVLSLQREAQRWRERQHQPE